MSDKIRLIVADDHNLFREGLRHLLQSGTGFQVVAEAKNGKEAVDLVKTVRADILLLDFDMPVMDGVTTLDVIRRRFPSFLIIILADRFNERQASELVAKGANCVLTKCCTKQQLHAAIKCVFEEGFYCDESISRAMRSALVRSAGGGPPSGDVSLTSKEVIILKYLCKGISNKEIADNVHMSVSGVDFYIAQIYTKTGCRNKVHLFGYALKNDLVSLSEV